MSDVDSLMTKQSTTFFGAADVDGRRQEAEQRERRHGRRLQPESRPAGANHKTFTFCHTFVLRGAVSADMRIDDARLRQLISGLAGCGAISPWGTASKILVLSSVVSLCSALVATARKADLTVVLVMVLSCRTTGL